MVRCPILLFLALTLTAAEHKGIVRFGSLPAPGVTVTATRGERTLATITDAQGLYSFPDLPDGTWTVQVEMQLFRTERREILISGAPSSAEWELTLLPASELARLSSPAASSGTKASFQRPAVNAAKGARQQKAEDGPSQEQDPEAIAELARRAADGFLINGSVNNAASSPFAQLPAFGNNRRSRRSLYNGSLGLIGNNSLFDARAFSLTGQETPKPGYNRVQGLLSFGGPLVIPKLLQRNGPVFTLNYQWTRNSNATTQTGQMPTAAQRAGDFSADPRSIIDPATGAPFPENRIPENRISPQARALLDLYPLPNFTGGGRYNYQTALVSGLHQDDLQARINKRFGRNSLSGTFAAQSTRSDTPDLFGFLETGSITGMNTAVTYGRSFSSRTFVNIGYQLNRLNTRVTPWFAGRRNVSAEAGIAGNNQDPVNWGPPALVFSSGITPLTQAQSSFTRNQTSGVSVDWFLSRGRHNVRLGFGHKRQQFNVLGQQDPRGTLAFTGEAAGHDFAGFLLGVPDTSAIAFGNADKYLRATINEGFINDDWRVHPGLTINAGLRWEYWSPVTEKYGRLVNLEVGPAFATAVPVVAASGSAAAFPRPDRNNFAPRIAFSWRPFAASSMVVRAGYGIYYDTSVYQPVAMQMAQQAPLSNSLRVANSPATPLTLADPFRASASTTEATTFGVDPDFRIGYSQNWHLSVQRDLPGALQMTATYLGGKGTRAQQQILPNTFPDGSVYPSGFTWLMSNGNSIRHAAQLQLRRRLRSGLTAQIQYTLAKSIDNATLGGKKQSASLIAQNWLDLAAERGLSNFDQRHLLTASVQYTTGMGIRGSALRNGWLGVLLREWTFGSEINAGSGFPLTPVYFNPVRGTGVTGSLRPDYTGAPLYDAPSGLFLNPAAYAPPAPGTWGNAGRNSITGPSQFVLNASLGRTLRSNERVSLDLRLDVNNALNYVTFTRWNTVVGNEQFGLPVAANAMRTVQATIRLRF